MSRDYKISRSDAVQSAARNPCLVWSTLAVSYFVSDVQAWTPAIAIAIGRCDSGL